MKNLLPFDGEVYLYENFTVQNQASKWYETLYNTIQWKQDEIFLFGKKVKVPRLQAWYGDSKATYTYSGLKMIPHPWTPELLQIKKQVEEITGHTYNGVLANLYRHGMDSMGWHSDDEKELGANPEIASVSLGAERLFRFRHKRDKKQIIKIPLKHGSLLVMKGSTQHYWQHDVPKQPKISEPRINLTFRSIV